MKKHLIAAAVAAAVAAPAMAQNVELYGTLDAGVARITGAGADKTNISTYQDSSVSSSVWGMRGSEDLGGGLKAIFDLQGDVQTNNGGLNNNGIFRRAANVGVSGAFGDLRFGTRINPIIATNSALMPVSGNSVSTLTAAALSYDNFFTKNAVTWTSQNLNGFQAEAQYGFNNASAASTQGGTVAAGSVAYTTGGLTFRAAGHNRKDNGGTSSANSAISAANAAADVNVNTASFAATAYVAGASYKMGDLTVALAAMQNKEATVLGGAKFERSATQWGVGYQATPVWLLGASYTTGEGSSLTNLQARYTLSKRTTGYLQYGLSDNNNNPTATKQLSFLPYAGNTGFSTGQLISGYSAAGTANSRSSGAGLGLIHTF